MNQIVTKVLMIKDEWSIVELMKTSKQSSRAVYSTLRALASLGILSLTRGKIHLLYSPSRFAFQELVVGGFDANIFDRWGIHALVFLLRPHNTQELSLELGLSYSQTKQVLNRLSGFLVKTNSTYQVSEKSHLRTFLNQAKLVLDKGSFWKGNGVSLFKIPLESTIKGTLTGFSRFKDFSVAIDSPVQYVIQPEQQLKAEQILVHAIKFSESKNDMALCTIFYLKNKPMMSVELIESEARRVDAQNLWNDMATWLEDLPPQHPELFLPKQEFLEKAAIYHVKIPPRYGLQTARELFDQLDQNMDNPVTIYLIGGSALLEHGLKTTTKDIDIVVKTKHEAKELAKTLKKIGYANPTTIEKQYAQLSTTFMMEKNNSPRLDVFVKKICNCLEFSPGMQKRSLLFRSGKLTLYYACPEDVLLLKSVSSRDADVSDSQRILKEKKIDWKIVQNELQKQKENLKQLNELTILEHWETLEKNLGITIPAKRKLEVQAIEKGILFICKKPLAVHDIRQKINFPEYTIRNALNRLLKTKKITKRIINGKTSYQTKK